MEETMRSELGKFRKAILASTLVLGASALARPALAAVFTVDDVNDLPDVNAADNVCRTAANTCTLRAAIMQANATPAVDTIRLRDRVYKLNRPGTDNSASRGDLDIRQNVYITVLPAGAQATVQGNGLSNDGIFHVLGGNNVRIERLVIDQQGAGTTGVGVHTEPGTRVRMDNVQIVNCVTTGNGGGILNQGEMTLANSLVGSNRASSANGGGIFNENAASLTLEATRLRSNTARADGGAIYSRGRVLMRQSAILSSSATRGGAIFQEAGATRMADSTIVANKASDRGGGAFVRAGALEMTRSTAEGNTAGVSGGALWNSPGGTMSLVNSTLSGNRAQNHGGGVYNDRGRINAYSITISANAADSDNDGSGQGGGIWNAAGGAVAVIDTVLAGNTRRLAAPIRSDCSGQVRSLGYTLLGTNAGCGFISAAGDQVGTPATPINPMVAPLAGNGGPTRTHALLAGSPAIDRGNPAGCRDPGGALLATDQRGPGYPRTKDGNGDGTAICDVGAFER
jgi:predicted outer membrane repeat protein